MVDEPRIVQLVTMSFVAPSIKRTVLVPTEFEVLVFVSVSEFPPVFRPLMVTLSAPLRLINALPALIALEIVRAPTGVIRIDV